MDVDLVSTTRTVANSPETAALPAFGEAHLRALFEATVDGIISIDHRGLIQTFNPAAERLFGYAASEVIGKNVSLLMPPPYQAEHDGYMARYLATGEKRIIGIGREVVGLRQNGTIFPMDLSVAEALVGSERMFVGIVRDLSARKQAEESRAQLAAIVESSDDAIIGKTLDGTITSWNAGAERLYGYSAAEMKGRPIFLLAPPDRPDEQKAILRRIKRGESVDHYETSRIRKDGQRIDVSLTVSPIKDSAGNIAGASVIARDITAQKRMNEEMRTMAQQLWQSAKLASVGELAASIAHELNNPLGTVTLRLESVLARTPAGDPRRKPLEIVAQETRRMAELVANLLQFSRRSADQVSTVDPRSELAKAVELIDHLLRKRLINVVREFAPDTPIIFADRQKLRQVFLNLLTNASDAMPNGGDLALRIAPSVADDGRSTVVIEIADTGVGIPPENVEKIMEPFFTTKEEGKGTGLGLAICRRVIQEGQGDIQISSRVGKGTTVRLILPVKIDSNVGRIRGTAAID